MEKSGNIEDQVIDHLLRSYMKQQRPPEGNCEGFDPDIASLYLERVLAEKEASHYEIHLFECSPCRNSVIALARFAEQETPFALVNPIGDQQTINAAIETEQKTVVEASANWRERLMAFFGVFATPRFALGAVAAIVLAISIPLVISQRGRNALNSSDQTSRAGESFKSDAPLQIAQAPPTQSATPSTDGENGQQALSPGRNNPVEPPAATNPSRSQPVAGTGSASGGSGAPTPVADMTTGPEKKEAEKSDTTSVAANKPRTEEPAKTERAGEAPAAVAAAPAPAPRAADRRELPRIDTKDTLRVPENDKDVASRTIKPGRSDGTVATANKPTGGTIRPGDPSAQLPSTESARRKGLADKAKSLRDESDVRKEGARASASRKIDNKTFWLIDDIWTDKDYKKDKELPVVTIIKESDVYREVLEKRSSLQKFFTGFAANDKVIVVYKGTVYRLIPRDGN